MPTVTLLCNGRNGRTGPTVTSYKSHDVTSCTSPLELIDPNTGLVVCYTLSDSLSLTLSLYLFVSLSSRLQRSLCTPMGVRCSAATTYLPAQYREDLPRTPCASPYHVQGSSPTGYGTSAATACERNKADTPWVG
ncbi:unnamed protein product [Ectocarpus sp. 12 AP-2014]